MSITLEGEPPRRPGLGWFTGWFNLIGQIAVTASIDYGAAIFTTALLNLWFPAVVGTDTATIFMVYTAIVAAHWALNRINVSFLGQLNSFSAWWHMAGVALIVVVLVVVPDHHQSVGFVFGQTLDNSGFGEGVGEASHRPGRAAAARRRRRPVLLRHGVGDRGLPHALRVLPRRRGARIAGVAQGRAQPGAGERRQR